MGSPRGRLSSLWRNLAHRARVDRDLDDELQATFDLVVEEKMRGGLAEGAARRAAAAEMGPLDSTRQKVREVRAGAWLDTLAHDLRYGLRRLGRDPSFTLFAILSLALGIGANTAIFSLWNGMVRSPLPAVRQPEQLVMLSDPSRSGSWTGRWDGRTDGARAWLTCEEFQQVRDRAASFEGLMASQSNLTDWTIRFDGGAGEEASGRLVSDEFFQVLGADAAIGRVFTPGDDPGAALGAVLSHGYWQRRFAGRADVLGRTLTVRQAVFQVIGVGPPGFIGETAGQQPDFWLPMRAQPLVMPDRDRLHDTPPDKAMWLQVFGRLKPGVTPAQAEAEANAIFRAGLESFYGDVAAERRSEFLDQRLRLRPAARGASPRRAEFGQSLTALLAAVGVLLLIACANLATLLLARGAARKPEIALRLSLGATRARLLRQLLTESLALAALAGLAALAVAYALHGALVGMLARSDPDFHMGFGLDGVVLSFVVAATVAAAMLFGLLPAWQVTRSDTNLREEESRGGVGFMGQQRSGRSLVGVQLALSLPLLVGAGLLARTVHNLNHADLGYPAERLLLVRVDLRAASYDAARRDAVLRALLGEIGRTPGVRAVSFSQLGLFTGGESNTTIRAEGHEPRGDDDRSSAVDFVGAHYFSTLGIPIVRGRDLQESDGAGAAESCLVNEGFVRRFFDGRDPVGLRIAQVEDGEDVARSCEVVGVARDARTHDLRNAIAPRFYVAGLQALPRVKSPTFLIRTSGESKAVMAAVRRSVERVDPALPIVSARSLDEQLAPRTAQDRTTAQLAAAFAAVALVLAAIGLYGVLSYGIARRTREIAVRIALGAQPSGVVAMILRETVGLLLAGLAAGLGLTLAASRVIGARLYGVAPGDPLTVAASVVVLLMVALAAAYAPAHRASRLDPMTALRQA